MGHPSSDAVLTLDEVSSTGLVYRLGLKFRFPGHPTPPQERLEPQRTIRLQVASPPPRRIDGSEWYEGLRVNDGTEAGGTFSRDDDRWQSLGVFAPNNGGPKNLGEPDPKTLIFDEDVVVPVVSAQEQRSTAVRLLRTGEPVVGEAQNFLSVYYDLGLLGLESLPSTPVPVTYYTGGELRFTGKVGPWIAISLSRFRPADRVSADIIAPVVPDDRGSDL